VEEAAMRFQNANASLFVPDDIPEDWALSRTTHLCIAAHPGDMEMMADHGISLCLNREDLWITGVVVTDGSDECWGSLYYDPGRGLTEKLRLKEQQKAACVGEYAAHIQLGYSTKRVKDPQDNVIVDELVTILNHCQPGVVYLHNPADKDDTHVAVFLKALKALRKLPRDRHPQRVYGCELLGSLDWLLDEDKEMLSVSAHPSIASSIAGVFDSRNHEVTRYDLAKAGRSLANATYRISSISDRETALAYAMDLNPLLRDSHISVADYTRERVRRFREDIEERIKLLEGSLPSEPALRYERCL
jgi:hypothetical protein